ncbi:hypothetical protein BC628DRAFT_419677 [Trametes gibbosa]|nr:hypothetical protein BC628DRAFT_419677 [Trametes gibbosa]
MHQQRLRKPSSHFFRIRITSERDTVPPRGRRAFFLPHHQSSQPRWSQLAHLSPLPRPRANTMVVRGGGGLPPKLRPPVHAPTPARHTVTINVVCTASEREGRLCSVAARGLCDFVCARSAPARVPPPSPHCPPPVSSPSPGGWHAHREAGTKLALRLARPSRPGRLTRTGPVAAAAALLKLVCVCLGRTKASAGTARWLAGLTCARRNGGLLACALPTRSLQVVVRWCPAGAASVVDARYLLRRAQRSSFSSEYILEGDGRTLGLQCVRARSTYIGSEGRRRVGGVSGGGRATRYNMLQQRELLQCGSSAIRETKRGRYGTEREREREKEEKRGKRLSTVRRGEKGGTGIERGQRLE